MRTSSFKKMLSIVVALIMALALLPSLNAFQRTTEAETANNNETAIYEKTYPEAVDNEKELDAYFDEVWKSINAVEAISSSLRAPSDKVVEYTLNAARQSDMIDPDSIADKDENGFSFKTVEGYSCAYDYRIRTHIANNDYAKSENVEATYGGTRSQTADNQNVLLIGPYYGSDSSFTNQNKTRRRTSPIIQAEP